MMTGSFQIVTEMKPQGDQPQAMLIDSLYTVRPANKGYVITGARQVAPHHTANRANAVDNQLHIFLQVISVIHQLAFGEYGIYFKNWLSGCQNRQPESGNSSRRLLDRL